MLKREVIFRGIRSVSIFLLAVLISGCIRFDFGDYVTFEFETTGNEHFYARTTDEKVIEHARKQLSYPEDQRNLFISGKIERGTAENNGWSWHFIPNEWQLVQVSMEVCDGRPSYVEENISYWMDNIGRFCPFNSRVIREIE